MENCAEQIFNLLGKKVEVKSEPPVNQNTQDYERAIGNSQFLKTVLIPALTSIVNHGKIAKTLLSCKLNIVKFAQDLPQLVEFNEESGSLSFSFPFKSPVYESTILAAIDSKISFMQLEAASLLRSKILPAFQDELTKAIQAPISMDLDWSTFAAEDLQRLVVNDGKAVADSVIAAITKLPTDDIERDLIARHINGVVLSNFNATPLDPSSSSKALDQNRWAITNSTLIFHYICGTNSVINQGSLLGQKLYSVLDTAFNLSLESQRIRGAKLLENTCQQVDELFQSNVKALINLPLTFQFDKKSIEELPLDKQANATKNVLRGLAGIFKALTTVLTELLANEVCREVLEKPEGSLGLNHIVIRHVPGSSTPKEVKLEDKVLSFKVPFEDNYVGDYWGSKITIALEDAFQFSVLKTMKSIIDESLPQLQEELQTLLGPTSEDVIISIDWDSVMLSDPSKRGTVLANMSRDKLDFARHAILKAISKLFELYNDPARDLIREQLQEVVIKSVPGDAKDIQRLKFADKKLILTLPFETTNCRLSWTEVQPFLDKSMDISLKLLPGVLAKLIEELNQQLGGRIVVEFDHESILQFINNTKKDLKNEDEKKGLQLMAYERLTAGKGNLFIAPIVEASKKDQFKGVQRIVISCGSLKNAQNATHFHSDTSVLSISLVLTQAGPISFDLTSYRLLDAVEKPGTTMTWQSVELILDSRSDNGGTSGHYSGGNFYHPHHATYVVRYGRSLVTVTTLRCVAVRRVFRYR